MDGIYLCQSVKKAQENSRKVLADFDKGTGLIFWDDSTHTITKGSSNIKAKN